MFSGNTERYYWYTGNKISPSQSRYTIPLQENNIDKG
jgi:hypothetical protein